MAMPNDLKRHLRFWDSVAITVGIVIGVGIFRTPSQIAQFLDSPSWILLAWLIGGGISLLGVFCYAELASQFPHTGGTYVFLREAYGKCVGFIYGWSEFSINRAASIAAVAYIFATYLRNLVPYSAEGERWVAMMAVCVFTVVNMVGVRFGIRIQNLLSSFKVLAILVVVVLIFWWTGSGRAGDLSIPAPGFHSLRISQLAPALIPILWSYGGWHESTFMSGEFHDTRKELPVSLIVSAVIVTALYVSINAAYLKVFAPSEMVGAKAIAADALMKLFGNTGSLIITVAVLISALGALNSNVLTGGRLPFSVAQDTPRLAWFAQVSKFGTPLRSLLLNGIWASVLVLWGNFEQLLFFNAFEIWLFFILIGVSVFILRRREHEASGFRMIGYPIVPILFTLAAAWLCWTTVRHSPRESLAGALLIAAGIPVYFLVSRGKRVP